MITTSYHPKQAAQQTGVIMCLSPTLTSILGRVRRYSMTLMLLSMTQMWSIVNPSNQTSVLFLLPSSFRSGSFFIKLVQESLYLCAYIFIILHGCSIVMEVTPRLQQILEFLEVVIVCSQTEEADVLVSFIEVAIDDEANT